MGLARLDSGDRMIADAPIRDAATIILVRDPDTAPSVLMGLRGKGAVFMPDKYVFPGGAVDPDDGEIRLVGKLSDVCTRRLGLHSQGASANALAATAIRELWEETGLILGHSDVWDDAPADWREFARAGYRPDASPLALFFRAVTPPGRPRRFDARFFLANAADLASDPGEMPEASDELSHLHWVTLADARKLNLAFITQLVLAELNRHLPSTGAPDSVPFVRNDTLDSQVVWL